jgi:hypothetical protein
MRDFKKIKTLDDWATLDAPVELESDEIPNVPDDQMILRMLLRPKYGEFHIPENLSWMRDRIHGLARMDRAITGISNSWCYITVRSGMPFPTTDEWHFDGGSLRVELIPERNYIWCSKFGVQYKLGSVEYPDDFDPVKHNLFTYASKQVEEEPVHTAKEKTWYLLSPFCLHRRDPASNGHHRTFIRVSFIDIEVRDVRCTPNPLFPTEAYNRDPVASFRDRLVDYP